MGPGPPGCGIAKRLSPSRPVTLDPYYLTNTNPSQLFSVSNQKGGESEGRVRKSICILHKPFFPLSQLFYPRACPVYPHLSPNNFCAFAPESRNNVVDGKMSPVLSWECQELNNLRQVARPFDEKKKKHRNRTRFFFEKGGVPMDLARPELRNPINSLIKP